MNRFNVNSILFLVETSYYEPTSFQSKPESHKEEEENFCLEFNSNKKITQSMLDAIVIYLENKATGADIQSFQIEPESNGNLIY